MRGAHLDDECLSFLCQKRAPHSTSQVDAAVGLATKLYSSSAKELSEQVSKRGWARERAARAGGRGCRAKKKKQEIRDERGEMGDERLEIRNERWEMGDNR